MPRRDGDMLGLSVSKQGHVHIEGVTLITRRPGVRVWYVETEQKRPAVSSSYTYGDRGRHEDFILWLDVAETKLYLRDGEDGSAYTQLDVRLPREPRFWRTTWSVYLETEKWGAVIVAVRQRRMKYWGRRDLLGRQTWASGPQEETGTTGVSETSAATSDADER